jgi:hypothetical protein
LIGEEKRKKLEEGLDILLSLQKKFLEEHGFAYDERELWGS